jgi:hypothetical protein
MTGQKFVRVLLLGYGGSITGAALSSDVQPTRKRRMNLHDGVDDVAIIALRTVVPCEGCVMGCGDAPCGHQCNLHLLVPTKKKTKFPIRLDLAAECYFWDMNKGQENVNDRHQKSK